MQFWGDLCGAGKEFLDNGVLLAFIEDLDLLEL